MRSAWAYVGGAWKQVASFIPPLTASATGTSVSGQTFGTSATTESTTVIPSGGLGPYTYSWVRISGVVGSASFPTSATTSFYADLSPNETAVSTFRCTVTDAIGQTATVDVTATFAQITFS